MHTLVRSIFALVLTLSGFAAARAADDLVIADFEGADYGHWKSIGEAFGPGPARGTLPGQMPVSGFAGQGLVNSFFRGDGTTGTLTSPPIRLERKHVQFLLGGGNHPGQTCINLLAGGKVVRTATYDGGDGSEHLEPRAWDVSDLLGQEVTIEIVDRHTGGWGHVNVDQIVQTDRPLPGWQIEPKRVVVAEHRYLLLPVKTGASKRRVRVTADGEEPRNFEIELADAEPDWRAVLDVGSWRGKQATLAVDRLREGSKGLEQIGQSDTLPDARGLYQEALRPQFHFSAQRGWLNDPNGLVYDNGEYHLFFQHNPYGWNWGNMHWGHAVSSDLVHWRQLPIAIYPDQLGTVFSGSAVVDEKNTAGFQTGSQPPIVCIYTAAGDKFTQCLAYSNDSGRSWTKYAGNPVLTQLAGGNRDPKVFWHEPSGRWVMALYLDKNDFAIFSSSNLKQWEKQSDLRLPGVIECPELFPIAVAGSPGEQRWIFYGGNGDYLIGQFDGRKFETSSGPHPLHHGNCFYASQTYNQLPAADGRRILVPWGQVALPGMPFNQMMGLPVELTLHAVGDGLRLFAEPIKELQSLRAETQKFPPQSLEPGQNPLAGTTGELVEVIAEFSPGTAKQILFKLRSVEILYDVEKQELACLDRRGPLAADAGKIRLQFLVDRASIDIFGNRGALYMPMGTIVPRADRTLEISSRGGAATIHALEVHRLRSAWPEAVAE